MASVTGCVSPPVSESECFLLTLARFPGLVRATMQKVKLRLANKDIKATWQMPPPSFGMPSTLCLVPLAT